ncbi:hypothetical protein KP509_01G034800 [Ceratopteris richardii]|uniref:Cytochrome P450 n=1 Tax=Ceratopteris richardii TaxID=49495 RepID=A0A8T2VFC2_CERRI|nr:hypothetical protein KP509_01G034800 [Ceratopteris richardii]
MEVQPKPTPPDFNFEIATVQVNGHSTRGTPRIPQSRETLFVVTFASRAACFHKLSLDPHKSLQSLSRTYGPLTFLKIGSVPVIVVSSPEMAKNILQKQDQNFACDLYRSCREYFITWRSIRHICATQLFAPTKIKSFQPIILEEVRSMLRSIDAEGKQKSCARSKLHAASSNIISIMALGKKLQMNESNSTANASSHLTSLLDIFAGGTDTSSITVEWALAELISHPSKMERVQDEIDEVVGNSRLVEQDDVQNMRYFQAVIKETMRLHPVIPFLVPRMAKQECRIEDFDIPANALTFINVAIGRDENVWENPLDFSPERFLGSDFDIRGRHFELPTFDFEPDERLDKIEKFGFVMALANPLLLKASRRIPIHLLE